MSDLSATQCGCNTSPTSGSGNGCCSLIWLIILLSICCNGDSWGCGGGPSGLFGGGSDSCGCGCNSWIWLLLLFCCCGNNSCC